MVLGNQIVSVTVSAVFGRMIPEGSVKCVTGEVGAGISG